MERLLGIGFIVISATAFGAVPLFANVAYREGMTPVSVLFLRFSIAAVVLLCLTTIKKRSFPSGKILLLLILMGAVGYAGQSFSYFTALRFAPSGLVSVLLYIYPALVAGLSFLVLKQSIPRVKLFALLLSLAGIPFTIGLKFGSQSLGILLAILAAMIYSVYIIIGTKVTRETDILVSSTIIITSAGVIYGSYIAWKGLSFPATSVGWGAIFGLALISTVIAVLMFFEGLKRIGPVDASMLSTLEPVVTVGLAWRFMGERLTMMNMFGGLMILAAAILLARYETKPTDEYK